MDSCDEIKAIFSKLSPDNQKHLLMLSRMAYVAECSVKQFLNVPIDQAFSHEIFTGLCNKDAECDAMGPLQVPVDDKTLQKAIEPESNNTSAEEETL